MKAKFKCICCGFIYIVIGYDGTECIKCFNCKSQIMECINLFRGIEPNNVEILGVQGKMKIIGIEKVDIPIGKVDIPIKNSEEKELKEIENEIIQSIVEEEEENIKLDTWQEQIKDNYIKQLNCEENLDFSDLSYSDNDMMYEEEEE